ncbi:MAG: aminopeptidase P family protein [Hyphomicrobiaceae bacterium]|nr:aminopeptidase P family protein [Hyphomicrobiaceae bacterium]
MYQDFSAASDPTVSAARIRSLQQRLAALGLDAVVVPRSDEHMGEYVPASAERLKWLTGFAGSAGLASIGRKRAALFVDGRYTLQAAQQVDTSLLEVRQIPEAKLSDWLIAEMGDGAVVGYDPWLHTTAWVRALEAALARRSIKLKALARNPVDQLWGKERPGAPLGAVTVQPVEWAGESAEVKVARLQNGLKAEGRDAAILTLPDSIAWLLNIRGSDVKHNPTPLAFAILHASAKPELFIDKRKLDADTRSHLAGLARLREPKELAERVGALKDGKRRVALDENTAAHWFRRALGVGNRLVTSADDPCILPKARKNAAEIRGARIAHERDGAAMARYLAWLDREAPTGRVDEIEAVKKLEALRSETQALKEISFDTISGSGPNGAIVHYRVTEASSRKLGKGELFLVDSGAQYQEGTTDVTRTVAIGKPTQEMRERFTLVLKGHIAISMLRFPKGTTGAQIDAFARKALWDAGLDFDHGTGHGVGSYLSVHEGPQSISKRGHVAIEPGMIISNEPGYYKTGAYGIRIENLVLASEPAAIAGGEREMMGFETLTLVPIDRRLVEPRLMTQPEIAWLDAYHRRVRETIEPHLAGDDRSWLEQATAPVGKVK